MAQEHAVCPKCHLAVREGQLSITHQGKTYHRDCAPRPESAGEKDNPYESVIGI
jgi:hypothetical protein